MQRNGPAVPPAGTGTAPLAGSAPAANPGMVGEVLAKMLGEQNVADQSYPVKMIGNMKRLAAVLIAHMDQSHPEVARHMTRAYTALEAALSAAEKAGKQNVAPKIEPPLGFSGAQTGGQPNAPAPTGVF